MLEIGVAGDDRFLEDISMIEGIAYALNAGLFKEISKIREVEKECSGVS